MRYLPLPDIEYIEEERYIDYLVLAKRINRNGIFTTIYKNDFTECIWADLYRSESRPTAQFNVDINGFYFI